jgi:hypothetical protein
MKFLNLLYNTKHDQCCGALCENMNIELYNARDRERERGLCFMMITLLPHSYMK